MPAGALFQHRAHVAATAEQIRDPGIPGGEWHHENAAGNSSAVLVLMAGSPLAGLPIDRAWGRVVEPGTSFRLCRPRRRALRKQGPGSIPRPGAKRPAIDRAASPPADQVEGIGLKTVAVKAADRARLLRLTGVTDYDPETLTFVRLPV